MQAAQERREQELRQLVLEGVPLRTQGKSGHWTLGPLHIYTAAGRWFSEQTGRRGRLNGQLMRQVIDAEYDPSMLLEDQPREFDDPSPSIVRRGQQLCPEAARETRRMTVLYHQYAAFMMRAAKHTVKYERFMRDARSTQCNKEYQASA
jgi:hypothetical protein